MPVLVTCKFYEVRIKTENVSVETSFLNFRHSRASNFAVNGPTLLEIELFRDFMPALVTSFDEDPIKNERAGSETSFSHYKSMGNLLEAQGHLTRKGVVRSGRNSNSCEI